MAGNGTAADLKAAMISTLSSDAAVTGIVGARIYEYAQTGEASYPFLQIGDGHEIDDSTECIKASDAFFDVHAWSRPDIPSTTEVMRLASAVRSALHNVDLTLVSNRLVDIRCSGILYRPPETDPPPVYHAVVSFHAIVEEL